MGALPPSAPRPPPSLPSRALLGALLALCAGCPAEETVGVGGVLALEPGALSFPSRTVGAEEVRQVRVRNLGRTRLGVAWTLPPAPFRVEGLPTELPPGERTFTVRFAPTAPGRFEARLEARDAARPGAEALVLQLSAEARAAPACPAVDDCQATRFDVAQEACVTEVLADGTPCGEGNVCLSEGRCQQGVCRGSLRTCDDGNACTVDVCNPATGCEALPAPPCPAGSACEEGVCDPQVGCTTRPVTDGTPCEGGSTGCDSADVCIQGRCEQRDPPDGFVCAEATPCEGQGQCAGSQCVRAPAEGLALDFLFDARTPPEVDPQQAETLHDFWMDEAGAMSLAGWPWALPRLDVTERPQGEWVVGASFSRRCVDWAGRPTCSDFWTLEEDPSGKVSVLDRQTGAARWTADVRTERPELSALFSSQSTSHVFITRLATLGPDRLLALYEGYLPDTGTGGDGRRRYVAAIFDATGRTVAATVLEDALLEREDHPHPFGVAADALGNAYLAFSPSVGAPSGGGLEAGSPTLVVSLSREGLVRWKKTYPWRGGELAVGAGVLVPERGGELLSVVDGSTRAAPGVPGRAVLGTGHLVRQDFAGGRALVGHALPGLEEVWRWEPGQGNPLATTRLALARWRPREAVDRTVALTVTAALEGDGTAAFHALVGLDVRTGRQVFQCPLPSFEGQPGWGDGLGEVQRLHLAGGWLGMMDRSTHVSDDPPFAEGQARFSRIRVPTLLSPQAPWSGEYGGPGHGHQEHLPTLSTPTAR